MWGRTVLLAAVALAGCGRVGFDPRGDGSVSDGELLWIVVHPSVAPDGPGIFAFSVDDLAPRGVLPIPADVASPHALVFDGTSLWIGGTDGTLVELDPADGSQRSIVQGVITEGLAPAGVALWYATVPPGPVTLVRFARDGTELFTVDTTLTLVNDIAFDGTSLYAVCNSESDPLVRIDVATGGATTIVEPVVTSIEVYTLTYRAGRLYVVDARGSERVLREIDPNGLVISERVLPLSGGFVTAIAFSGT